MPVHELMQGEGNFVGMRCTPGNNALEPDGIVGDGTDFHQLGFDDLRVSHVIPAWHTSATTLPCDARPETNICLACTARVG